MMNATFLSWLLKDVKMLAFASGWKSKEVWSSRIYSRKSRGKSTDASNIEKRKIHLKYETRGKFRDSVVGPLGILVALVKRQIWKGYSKSGIFSRRPSMSPFLAISFSLVIDNWPKCWWIIWERFCFENEQTVGATIFLSLWGFTLTKFYLNIVEIILSLVGWSTRTTLRFNKVTMFKRFRHNLRKPT